MDGKATSASAGGAAGAAGGAQRGEAPEPPAALPRGAAGPADLRPGREYPPIEAVENGDLAQGDMLAYIDAAMRQESLVGHNISVYDELVSGGIDRIMTQLFNVDRMLKNQRNQTEEDRRIATYQTSYVFHNVQVGRPSGTTYLTGQCTDLYPSRARLTGISYSGAVTLGATVTLRAYYEDGHVEEKTAEIPPFQIGGFPIMVGSLRCHTRGATREGLKELGEDPTDPGGYFIAKRGEWVVDLLENICYNKVHIHTRMKPNEVARAEFLSQPGGAFENSSQVRLRYMTNGQLTVEINSTKFEKVRLPFYVVYRLFGMTSDREVAETIVFDAETEDPLARRMLDVLERAFHLADAAFAPLVYELNRERLVQQTAERLAKYLTNPTAYASNESAVQFLNEDLLGSPTKPGGLDKVLLPHLGQTGAARIRKLRFLGLLFYKLLLVAEGVLPPTDRDKYSNKRVHGAGVSLAKAFKTQVNNGVVIPISRALKRELKNNPWAAVTDKTIVDTFRNALSTSDLNRAMEQAITAGNKTIVIRRRAATNRVSSQALERKNMLNTLCALRTVVTQNAGNASKQTDRADMMRRAHPTYTGFICAAHSPDTGENVGMRKQLAVTASVCTAGEAARLKMLLGDDPAVTRLDDAPSAEMARRGLARVFVNGEWVGVCESAHELAARYRALRREGRGVDPFATVYHDPVTDEVEFWLDVGRLRRPLLIVDNNLPAYDAALRAAHARAGKYRGYREGGSFTHDGAEYDLDCALAVVAGRPAVPVLVEEMRWVLEGPGAPAPDPARVAAADLAAPLLVADHRGRPVPVDGLHRLARALAEGRRALPARRISATELAFCREGAPARVEFTQNVRFTRAHVDGIRAGRITLADLVAEGVAEYVTPEEHENCYLAHSILELRARRHDVTAQFSHCEVEQAIFGLAAHLSPYGNHTQPARVTYETNQGRQTGGLYCLAWPYRTDKNRFLQFYNEVPLVRTLTHAVVPANGTNAYIAYASYGGDNQEDSAIICQAFADRGGFAGAFFRFEMAELEKGETFCNPDALTTKNLKPNACYEKLVDGFIRPGSVVRYGDILIGRVARLPRNRAGGDERYLYTDRSLVYRLHEPCVVEAVLKPRGANDELFGVVKLRLERPLRTGDKLCLTPDHEVLTSRGFVPIAEVSLCDAVACLHPETHELSYQKPTEIHQYDHDGLMYEIDSQLVSQCVTPNHRMWVKTRYADRYELIEAEEIAHERVSYMRDAVNPQPEQPVYWLYGTGHGEPDRAVEMDAWLDLLGAFISDGFSVSSKPYIQFSMKKARKINFLKSALDRLGLRYNHYRNSGKIEVISHPVYAELAPLSVGAVNKRLPRYVWSLGERQSRRLLDALIQGDGHVRKTMIMFSTSSVGLAEDVVRLALHSGYSANQRMQHPAGTQAMTNDGRIITATADFWRVGVIRSKNRPTVNHGHVHTQNRQEERYLRYVGRVHCLTVPTGIFYIRRKGVPGWTGNSSRSGNKSIVARLLPQSDMPFTEDGLTPDLIINTHSFPSRMTIGQLIETSVAKVCARRGVIADGTPFLPVDHEAIAQDLYDLGFRYNGRERMYNGMTGECFDAAIFIGPTAEQRLQKFVLDDEQAVAGSGPTDATTGQPLGGKHLQGGLRLGEMEFWCLESHGSLLNLQRKASVDSDGRKMHVCRGCGSLAVYNEYQNIYLCRLCGDLADIAEVDGSKSAVLMHEELAASCIRVQLGLAPREFEEYRGAS